MSGYDVYYEWLGITPEEQPPNYYRLLGIAEFERNLDVIRNAAERQMAHVRRYARGEFTDVGQELLNEIAEAKLSLLSETTREAYNEQLRGSISGSAELYLAEIEANLLSIDSPPWSNMEEWVIGFGEQCDFRVEHETVSRIHCQLTQVGDRIYLSDLNSSNGTYINQQRIHRTTRLRPLDLVTLTKRHRIILPPGTLHSKSDVGAQAIYVGRATGSELRFDTRGVSLFHAKVVYGKESIVVEDLQSKRGTFVIRDGQGPTRIKRVRLQPADVILFADEAIESKELFRLRNHVENRQ